MSLGEWRFGVASENVADSDEGTLEQRAQRARLRIRCDHRDFAETTIPLAVLAEFLRRAGYAVTNPRGQPVRRRS